jgi:hypothetical protein
MTPCALCHECRHPCRPSSAGTRLDRQCLEPDRIQRGHDEVDYNGRCCANSEPLVVGVLGQPDTSDQVVNLPREHLTRSCQERHCRASAKRHTISFVPAERDDHRPRCTWAMAAIKQAQASPSVGANNLIRTNARSPLSSDNRP